MSIKIKELPLSERPYEKMEMYGPESLSNAELLAIIIKTGTKEETAVGLAQQILKLNSGGENNLSFLRELTVEEFMKIKEGIAPEVTIYSVVNSLTELSNIHKVQFLIDGKVRKMYEDLDVSSYFERNFDIIEGEQ